MLEPFCLDTFVNSFTNLDGEAMFGATRRKEAMTVRRIPAATVARLPIYVQGLKVLALEGVPRVSSSELAESTGVQASQIRRDLACLGAFGTPGVGYDVPRLLHELSHRLGLSRLWPVALMGCGKLGSALAAYSGFAERSFRIAAIFDSDPERVGTRVGDLVIHTPEEVGRIVRGLGITIAILAAPASCAQVAADLLVAAGVTSILNFAPVTLLVPEGVAVRNIDVAAEMQILSFREAMKRATDVRYPTRPAAQRRVSQWLRERS